MPDPYDMSGPLPDIGLPPKERWWEHLRRMYRSLTPAKRWWVAWVGIIPLLALEIALLAWWFGFNARSVTFLSVITILYWTVICWAAWGRH